MINPDTAEAVPASCAEEQQTRGGKCLLKRTTHGGEQLRNARSEGTGLISAGYVSRIRGFLPLVNSTPAFSRARWIASTVRGCRASPASNLEMVIAATLASLARSRIPSWSAARAIRD